MAESQTAAPSRLEILKALGDNTRYAIYLELARSPRPLATAEIADTLDLHANTVRPHLERMREVGLLDVDTDDQRRGRPAPAPLLAGPRRARRSASSPRPFPLLARMLLTVAAEAGLDGNDAEAAGRDQGGPGRRALPRGQPVHRGPDRPSSSTSASTPRPSAGADGATIAFTHCPFRELAEAHPDLVCGLHRGLVEGFVDGARRGAVVGRSAPWSTATPCQVELRRYPKCRSTFPVGLYDVAPSRTGGPPVITLTDSAAAKVKELIDAGGRRRPGAARRGASRRLLGLQLRDVLRQRRRRRRHQGRRSARWRSSSTRPAPAARGGDPRLQGRPDQGAGFAIDNPNAQRTCGCGQSFS